MDPGCLFPGWLTRSELVRAGDHAGQGSKADQRTLRHWAATLSFMESLEAIYGEDAVRLVFWFDTVPYELLHPKE